MKIMIDINVLMDVLQKRHPHFHASSLVLSKVLKNVSDFKNSPIKCLSPEELLLIISIPS